MERSIRSVGGKPSGARHRGGAACAPRQAKCCRARIHRQPFQRGQWLVTTSWDSQTILWGVARQQPALRLADAGNELRMHPEAARLGFQSWRDDQWKLFDLTPASEMVWLESHPRSALREGNRDLWRVVFLDNGLLVGVSNHGLNFWRLDEPATVFRLQGRSWDF